MADKITLNQTEVDVAAQQEENARLQAENKYLHQRVVTLRALVNRLNAKKEGDDEDVDSDDTPESGDSDQRDEG